MSQLSKISKLIFSAKYFESYFHLKLSLLLGHPVVLSIINLSSITVYSHYEFHQVDQGKGQFSACLQLFKVANVIVTMNIIHYSQDHC